MFSERPQYKYRLRVATLGDTNTITDLVVPLVSHDGFHDYFFPRQDQYPKDFYRWWYRYYRDLILRPYCVIHLLEDEDGKVVGMAGWGYNPKFLGIEDVPEPKGLHIAKNSLFEGESSPIVYQKLCINVRRYEIVLRRKTYTIIDRVTDKVHPNRCMDPEALLEWRKTMQDVASKLWTGDDCVNWFSPELFAVGNREKETTASSILINWGLHHADLDDVSTFIFARVNERKIYESQGFEVVLEGSCGPSKFLALKYTGYVDAD
jgi:hypothetical protein